MNIPKNVREVMDIMASLGFCPYLVGGCVRDTVMGITPHDYDVTSNASPEDVIKCFNDRGFKTYPLGREFGTVGVVSGGEVIEITPYRTESGYSDSRHPDKVEFVSDIRLDLSRRDFTVNAMAIDADGNILDLFGGKEDIKDGIIRCVGNASERLSEDALRILRAVRFASRFGFEIEESTKNAMRQHAHLLKSISGERICSELSGMLTSKYAYKVLCECEDIIRVIIPDFCADERLKDPYGDFIFRLFVCIHKSGERAASDAYALLKLSNAERDKLFALTRLYESPCISSHKLILDGSIRELLCSESPEAVTDVFRFYGASTDELLDFIENGVYTASALAIKGGDIISTKRFPREHTARVLRAVLLRVARGELENTRDSITKFLENCNLDFYTE